VGNRPEEVLHQMEHSEMQISHSETTLAALPHLDRKDLDQMKHLEMVRMVSIPRIQSQTRNHYYQDQNHFPRGQHQPRPSDSHLEMPETSQGSSVVNS
jgi:hypothetical protein